MVGNRKLSEISDFEKIEFWKFFLIDHGIILPDNYQPDFDTVTLNEMIFLDDFIIMNVSFKHPYTDKYKQWLDRKGFNTSNILILE